MCSSSQNCGQAMRSHDSARCKESMSDEMKSLNEQTTFELTTLPEGKEASRWTVGLHSERRFGR